MSLKPQKFIPGIIVACILLFLSAQGYNFLQRYLNENEILKEIITRLESDSRLAEILVTGVNYDENSNSTFTTIKFLEYDVDGNPLKPKYFTFSGNIIQFQSLVIRFDDVHVRQKDKLKGKSAYLFWKVFLLDGENTQEFAITEIDSIPDGYKLKDTQNPFEEKLWKEFWQLALDPQTASVQGIKNAQIEAPGTMFIPGHIYTIKIEHDGGLRIDVMPLPSILKGEKIS